MYCKTSNNESYISPPSNNYCINNIQYNNIIICVLYRLLSSSWRNMFMYMLYNSAPVRGAQYQYSSSHVPLHPNHTIYRLTGLQYLFKCCERAISEHLLNFRFNLFSTVERVCQPPMFDSARGASRSTSCSWASLSTLYMFDSVRGSSRPTYYSWMCL